MVRVEVRREGDVVGQGGQGGGLGGDGPGLGVQPVHELRLEGGGGGGRGGGAAGGDRAVGVARLLLQVEHVAGVGVLVGGLVLVLVVVVRLTPMGDKAVR